MNTKTQELNKRTLWTAKQRNHLRRLIKQKAVIAYVCTDQHGRPSNGGPKTVEWQLSPGLVQKVSGPLQLCGSKALHGTFEPHRWKGSRVWVAGFCGEVKQEENKLGSLHREIIGEVFPETAMSQSVLARLGCKELSGADLRGANLRVAALSRANLRGANLSTANLNGADLYGADLSSANLREANLRVANLIGANLSGADLRVANLSRTDLFRANLSGANLSGADLSGANLIGANLSKANLRVSDLYGADLSGADLHGAYRGDSSDIPGWTNKNGFLIKI